MDMNKYILSIVLMMLPFLQHAQRMEEAEIELSYYCDVMVNAAEPRHRISAGKEFERRFLKVLEDSSSFLQTAHSGCLPGSLPQAWEITVILE
jgi:hypothetical protein